MAKEDVKAAILAGDSAFRKDFNTDMANEGEEFRLYSENGSGETDGNVIASDYRDLSAEDQEWVVDETQSVGGKRPCVFS